MKLDLKYSKKIKTKMIALKIKMYCYHFVNEKNNEIK